MNFYKFINMNTSLKKGKPSLSKMTELDPTKINKNQLNSSSAKMQYSVPR